jgi:hypothetical protein
MDALAFVKAWHQTLKMHGECQYAHCTLGALGGLALLEGGTHLPPGAPGVLDGQLQGAPEGAPIADTVVFLPEGGLPEEHSGRFRSLFFAREHWRLDDLLPYLEPVKGPREAVSDMLLAHCRYITQQDGSKLYCQK